MRTKTVSVCLLLLSAGAGIAQRLPEGIAPVHYTLAFTPDIASARFEGHEEISVRLSKPTDTITLNALEIDFRKVRVTSSEGSQEATVALDAAHETASFKLASPIAAGEALIDIDFSGILNDKLRGFYLAHGTNRDYATTQLEATDARRAFPCFDEPALKAVFEISLTVDQRDTAISNSAIVSDTPGPGAGKHTLRFAPSPKMSTYLVAMVVGDWKCVDGAADGVPIRICATPDKAPLGRFALTATEHILHSLNQYFAIPYPFKKLDIIAVPDFEAGAMENIGAITYRERDLLVDERHSSVESRRQVAEVLAHEITHMWFGDLVTMKWWDDIWLNEGFATWMVSKPVGEWKPEWKEPLLDVQDTSRTLDVDSSPATRQIRAQATTPDEINELFDGIAYGKAGAVIRMAEQYAGPDVFRDGVRQFLTTYAYGNATAEDFWNTLSQVSGKPMDRIMGSFVDQPGVPLISVRTRCSGRKTTVDATQQPFYLQGSLMNKSSNQVWAIPACFTFGGAKDCRVLDQPRQSFTVDGCSADFSTDATGSGYYRTQYDSGTLHQLPGATWNAAQRQRLVGDTWALVQAGKVRVGEYLELLQRMGADREEVVFEDQVKPLPTIADYLMDGQDHQAFAKFIGNLVGPDFKRLGWVPASGEGDEDRELRPAVIDLLGEYGNDPAVLRQASRLADRYLRDHASLDASLVPTVLRLAAKTGGAPLYARVAEALRTAKSPEEVSNFVTALSAFSEPELVGRTLVLAVSPQVRSQDSPFVLVALIKNPATRRQSWAWIKEHWPDVQARFTMSSGSRVVAATGWFCDSADRDDVQSFFASHKVESSERTLSIALRRIDACVELRADQQSDLAAWLEKARARGTGAQSAEPARPSR